MLRHRPDVSTSLGGAAHFAGGARASFSGSADLAAIDYLKGAWLLSLADPRAATLNSCAPIKPQPHPNMGPALPDHFNGVRQTIKVKIEGFRYFEIWRDHQAGTSKRQVPNASQNSIAAVLKVQLGDKVAHRHPGCFSTVVTRLHHEHTSLHIGPLIKGLQSVDETWI